MALMCDIRIAAASTKMSESYVKVGIVPGDGAAYFLPRLVGTDKRSICFGREKFLKRKKRKRWG